MCLLIKIVEMKVTHLNDARCYYFISKLNNIKICLIFGSIYSVYFLFMQ